MHKKFSLSGALKDTPTHYCPGCGHGIVHRLLAEVIEELGIREKTIAIAPVGCAVIAYDYWNFDCSEAAHGRALAVATAMKRCRPDRIVFSYQGDGDLASIGLAETMHAANRGERVTCIFVNNACYGMTGGQMAPTTLVGQKTATSPSGRNPQAGDGWPIKVSELIAMLPGVSFVARTAITNPHGVIKTRAYIQKAFMHQLENKGFSLVEILSPCPTVWAKSPIESMKW
ncbi:MAG: 2-oxoglutarate oxidoreductase, partial [Candidatus Omnitrophica bacterium]|nr:2-oxoglutarate oxidoreductase [Candidatus Omnitrophota bacterium]